MDLFLVVLRHNICNLFFTHLILKPLKLVSRLQEKLIFFGRGDGRIAVLPNTRGYGVGLPRETIFCKCYDGAAFLSRV